MTFEEYVAYIGTPQNLKRESGMGPRIDFSATLRDAFEKSRLSEDQEAALRWLVALPNGPAKILVISEEFSSDCRRDLPTFARMAELSGMELRIFRRDGQRFSDASIPSLADEPDSNADIMAEFLNHKNGQTRQSIPVCAFYNSDMDYLYHFTEYPAIYHKDRLAQNQDAPLHGEREFTKLLESPFYHIWTSATVDEIISALHRKAVLGVV